MPPFPELLVGVAAGFTGKKAKGQRELLTSLAVRAETLPFSCASLSIISISERMQTYQLILHIFIEHLLCTNAIPGMN